MFSFRVNSPNDGNSGDSEVNRVVELSVRVV
jgi:hypothetical protein